MTTRARWWAGLSAAGWVLAAGLAVAQVGRTGMPRRPRPGPAPAAPTPAAPATAPAAPAEAPASPGPAGPHRRGFFYPYGPYGLYRPPILHGNNPRVRVLMAPRFDWTFALRSVSLADTPREVLLGHVSTQTTYQLWVPRSYRHDTPHPAVLFVSAKPAPDELLAWDPVCRKYNVLFAVAYNGGDEAHPAKRLRLTLDVLDDLRRRMNVDTDRVYLAGFSEGARTACEVAFAYPEFVGGVVAIGGAGAPREEPWLRDRAKERLSVALLTGELDPARREVEVLRFPVLRDAEVRSRLWVVPRLGHALPPAAFLEDAFVWLDGVSSARRTLGIDHPAARMAEGSMPASGDWARAVVDEAKRRLGEPQTREGGLMQLEGVRRRWPATPAAAAAGRLLDEQEGWQGVYDRRQREHYYRLATAVDDYLAGPLPTRDLLGKPQLLREAAALWEQVEKLGPETREGKVAHRRLAELRKLVPAAGRR